MRARVGVCSVVGVVAVLLAVACVNPQKRDMEAAQERLDACIAEYGREHPDCREAELALLDAQARYDEKARQAWSCDPTQDLCPTPR